MNLFVKIFPLKIKLDPQITLRIENYNVDSKRERIKKYKNECKYLTNKSNMFCQITKVLNL